MAPRLHRDQQPGQPTLRTRMEVVMLEHNPTREQATTNKDQPEPGKVTCFVCKKTVARDQARLVPHSREKQVWVCECHLK